MGRQTGRRSKLVLLRWETMVSGLGVAKFADDVADCIFQ